MPGLKTMVLVAGLLLILAGCSNSRSSTIPLTEEDVTNFIRDNEIHPIDVERIGDFVVILYSDTATYGYHLIYKDENGKLRDQNAYGGTQPDTPVLLSGSASRNPFVTVIIQDEEIRRSASAVEVTYEDGSTIRRSIRGQGAIIPYGKEIEGASSYSRVVIYDAENKALYSYPE
ncbi:hypothetical protein J19TS2_49730 [Cohnella xylanilytica]|uniref:hypothetical protein n=1 Tax=Cohnella xylanilytica TaxID=557555 RepID=UPI001B06B1C8|nr:hypothetical protein [Cohnella xylanilytica]GIO15418.1 hypothetical protein J19TS2_49730 [Cohnella xylanilytica]